MDYAVVGGDARFAYLTRLLDACGRDARAVNGEKCGVNVLTAEVDELKQAKNVVMNWPNPDGEWILEMLSPGTRIFTCGPGTPGGISCIDLWKDERLLTDNAWLTAEGAVSAAMNAGNASLKDCRCLVVGWGRIGKALTELLIGMHAKVTVASRSEKGRNSAAERGADVVSTYRLAESVGGKEIIFSTPPERVLTETELKHADPGAMVIDLSSAPFGVDLEAARRLNLRAWREPKLPGRYCPFSAARALLQAILRAERMNADG
ncbi:MAG: hypothetical protein IJO98_06990 [Clostridia bacterium]|nr:hypothetical protein [Clostridia bacterium]